MIKTQRLILRQWQKKDRNSFYDINSDPEVMKFFPKLYTRAESDSMINKMKSKIDEKGWGFFAVELKVTGELIGMIGLNKPDYELPFNPCVEIGWRLHKNFWRMGYATEGASACLDYAFHTLKLKKVVSFTAELNIPSMKVMEKIGMRRIANGDFNHPKVETDHKLQRHVLFEILNPKCE